MSQANSIPYNFDPRPYQIPFLSEIDKAIDGVSDKRYFYQIWHRRSGKDKVNIAFNVPMRLMKDPCLVKYVYPTLVMGRENLWDGIDGNGFRYIDHIPDYIRASSKNETTMKIPISGGSLFQIGGSDHPDSLRGGNPKMIVFSEWAEQDPYAWDVVEPIVRENDGIVIFNTTPKGDNHARGMYEYAKNNPKWYVEMLTAKDTGIWTEFELENILKDITKRFTANGRSQSEAESYFEQEYMCSFKAPVIGSYYGDAIRKAENEHRITEVRYNNSIPVHTAWDLGIDDSMTIWFYQHVGNEIRFIDYYENSGEGLAHYAQVEQDRHYLYGKQLAPHDIAVRELSSGKSRLEIAKGMGITFTVNPRLDIDDGINAGRTIFNRCWFDKTKCDRGINALKNYKKDWDEKNKVFRNNPKHDWASHGADAFRTFAVGFKENITISHIYDVGGVKPYYDGLP
jgi:phage terminase large subunit